MLEVNQLLAQVEDALRGQCAALLVLELVWLAAPDHLQFIGTVRHVNALLLIGALAWLVGFAMPGSSAGIGVREAVLIAALEGTLGAPASALIALALRLVTIGGDVVFFALGMTLGLAGGRPKPIALGEDLA